MSKRNGIQPLHESLPSGDARISQRILSVLQADEMKQACNRALAKRGIHPSKFGRMDFGKPKNKNHHE